MNIKPTKGQITFDLFNTKILFMLMVTMLYPILHVLFASFSNPYELMAHKGLLFRPLDFTANAYNMVFKNPMVVKGYGNTLFVVSAGVIVNIVLTSLGAYVLSRKDFMLKNSISLFIVFTMFFNGGLIPTYLNVKGLGFYDSLWALIVPSAISTFNLIIMRTGFAAIPDSLEESAKIDGAGHITILCKILNIRRNVKTKT